MTGGVLFNAGPGSRPRRELVPGAVHVPSWLTTGQQRWITERFDDWARGPVPARFAYHGVTKVHPGTVPAGCGLSEGRGNITMRVTGLT